MQALVSALHILISRIRAFYSKLNWASEDRITTLILTALHGSAVSPQQVYPEQVGRKRRVPYLAR